MLQRQKRAGDAAGWGDRGDRTFGCPRGPARHGAREWETSVTPLTLIQGRGSVILTCLSGPAESCGAHFRLYRPIRFTRTTTSPYMPFRKSALVFRGGREMSVLRA